MIDISVSTFSATKETQTTYGGFINGSKTV